MKSTTDVALVCASHSPLMDFTEPSAGVRDRVMKAFGEAREFVEDFGPDLVVLFAPDHYNGFFYDMMPPFCIGSHAISIGDYGSPSGEISVDKSAARRISAGVLSQGIDVAISEKMYVDHGFAQPLQILFGGLNNVQVVPIFINSLAEPLGPASRVRKLGQAVGVTLQQFARRILLLGSGGLSHDPPAPRLLDASPEVAARLVDQGRNLSPHQRAQREMKSIQAGRDLAAGIPTIRALNPHWDEQILDTIQAGELDKFDSWSNDWFIREAGHSSHETRTWLAAYSALSMFGQYSVTSRYYEPIPEWIAGFAITHATPDGAVKGAVAK